ncbi:MAG: hypothetical protein ACRC20_12240 [Segniliparus sp.]
MKNVKWADCRTLGQHAAPTGAAIAEEEEPTAGRPSALDKIEKKSLQKA